MATNYIGKTNLPSLLSLIKTAINKKVDAVEGKGLSANDLTDALKTSYDTAVTTVNELKAIGGEPNKINTIKVNGTAQTPDSSKAVDISVPTTATIKSQIENYGYQTASQVDTAITAKGYQTTTQVKTTVESYKYQTDANVKSTVTSYGYQTAAQVQSAINDALEGVTGIDIQVVTALPSTGVKGVIYLISDSHSDSNDSYDEYIWVSSTSAFEKIGNTDVDLSAYAKTADFTEITASEINSMWAST